MFGTVAIAVAFVSSLVVVVRINDGGGHEVAAVVGAGVAAGLVMTLSLLVLLAHGHALPGQSALLRPGEFVLEKMFGEQES